MKRFVILCLLLAGFAAMTAEARPADAGQETRKERRQREKAEKAVAYTNYMDSLIRSNVYSFRPRSIQIQPAGRNQRISTANYRMDVREDYIDIMLPYYTGTLPPYRRTVMDNNISNIPEYRAEQSADGSKWTITFENNLYSSDTYYFKFTVTTSTGNTVLEIRSSRSPTVTYEGYMTEIY